MKEHSEKDFGNASPSLVRSIVQRIEGGTCTLSKPISSPVPQPSRCHPEDLLNHTAKESAVAVVTQKRTPYTLTNRNSAADTLRNGSHSVTDPGSVNMKVRGSNEQSNCRRLSLRDKTMSESNSLEKKFRSTESLLNSRPSGQSNTSRPASAANSRTQDNVSAKSDRTTDPKESEHRSDSSRTGTGVTFRSRSRSIDDSSSSGQAPRSRSVEARSRTPLRSSVNADSGPTPSAFRTSCASVPVAVVCDAAPGKQMVVLSRTVTKRQSLTTPMTPESSSTAPDRKGLQQKLSSGRLGITADKLLPNYQPKRKLQSSVSVDANVVDCCVEVGDLRRSSSLYESATMPLLMVTFEDYPEPPPPEEDLNAKMEMLFEEYRKIELGLILKKVNREEEEQEHKVSEKRLPVERGRRMASTDRFSRAASPAQNPRVRSISLDRSLLPESRTSKKETSNTMPTRSDPVQSAVRDSRTRTKTPGLNQDNSRTRAVSATRLSNTRPSSSNARATAPVCPSNLTKSVIAQTPASSMSAKTLEDHRNHKNKSSDNLNRLPHTCNQNGKHNIQNSSYEPMIPKRDTSVTRNPRRNSATDLSSRTIEDRSGTIANGNARCSLDTSSCNVTNKHFAPTTVSQHTSIDVPPKNSLGNRRTTHPDINTAAVRKPTESATGSGKLDLRNGNNGKSDPAKVVPMADLEMSVKHGAEETRKTPLTKATGTDERLCSRSKIPVPIYSKKFNSSSQRSLKRCDSGVDIANNFKPEGDCAGLRIGQDKESKSKTPLILDPVSSHLIYNGRAATKTSPNNIDDDYY